MTSSRRSRAAALVSAAALAAALGACSSSGDGGSQAATDDGAPLEVWSRGGDPVAAETYQRVFDAFTEQTGIEVDYSLVAELDTQLQARAGQRDLPDVLINDAGSLGDYVDQGFLLPVDRDSLEGADQVSDETWDQTLGLDGQYYGVPWSRQANVVVVRKDWREALGLEVPQTWEELEAMAVAFAEQDPDGDGQADTYGMVVPGTATNGYIARWGAPFLWQAGGEVLVDDGEGHYTSEVDSPEVEEGMTYIRDLFCTPGAVVPGSINFATSDTPFFQEGTAGIYLTGPYNFNVFDEGVGRENVEVIPMPQGPASATTFAEGENIYFGASSTKTDQQQQLAEFLLTPEAQEIAMDSPAAGGDGPFSSVVRLPVNTSVDAGEVYDDPRWDVVADAYAESSKTFPWNIDFIPFRQVLADGMNAMAADCSSDIPTTLAQIDQGFEAEIAAQGLGQ